jgi:threonyl-tRNA synthetase
MEEGPGFPFFLPNGVVLKNNLINYWRGLHKKSGYVEIETPVTGACFLKPTVTEELLTLHSKYHKQFISFNEKTNAYYVPGSWSPHFTTVSIIIFL